MVFTAPSEKKAKAKKVELKLDPRSFADHPPNYLGFAVKKPEIAWEAEDVSMESPLTRSSPLSEENSTHSAKIDGESIAVGVMYNPRDRI